MAIVLSFDIDGTLELGDPPGPVTIEMVRRAHELGFIVGSCSDRPLSSQRAIWAKIDVTPSFVLAKHQLGNVRENVTADAEAYYHMGDRDTDLQVAQEHSFGFWWEHEAGEQPWLQLDPNATSK
jgi:hypothetical protein